MTPLILSFLIISKIYKQSWFTCRGLKKIEKFLNKPMPKIDDGINDLISNIKINNKIGKLTNDF